MSVTPSGRTVLFDFDGVLYRRDAFAAFVTDRFRAAPWRVPALVPLAVLAGAPWWRMAALRRMVDVALAGTRESAFHAALDPFVAGPGGDERAFHADGLAALRSHLDAGDRVLVVTGSEETVASAVLRRHGFGDVEVLGSVLRWARTGGSVAIHNIGPTKTDRLAAHGVADRWDVAYTDSALDLPLLRGAEQPVLVNPTPALCRRVERDLGRSVLSVRWA